MTPLRPPIDSACQTTPRQVCPRSGTCTRGTLSSPINCTQLSDGESEGHQM
jgi:hypothetical protein